MFWCPEVETVFGDLRDRPTERRSTRISRRHYRSFCSIWHLHSLPLSPFPSRLVMNFYARFSNSSPVSSDAHSSLQSTSGQTLQTIRHLYILARRHEQLQFYFFLVSQFTVYCVHVSCSLRLHRLESISLPKVSGISILSHIFLFWLLYSSKNYWIFEGLYPSISCLTFDNLCIIFRGYCAASPSGVRGGVSAPLGTKFSQEPPHGEPPLLWYSPEGIFLLKFNYYFVS